MKKRADFQIRAAHAEDEPIILQLIRDLATYERAPHEVTATEKQLADVLFGKRPAAEVLLAFEGKSPVGFAVYFYNFSTWLGRAGLYLEDLFVKPEKRGKGYGRALLVELAKIARDLRKLDKQCATIAFAALLRLHEQIFEIKAGSPEPCGKIMKENCEPDWRFSFKREKHFRRRPVHRIKHRQAVLRSR